MVIDPSVLISIFFKKEYETWSCNQLILNQGLWRMSTVSLAEVLMVVKNKRPQIFDKIKQELLGSEIRFIHLNDRQAMIAAEARQTYKSLNFGDCFVYALAKVEGCPIMTLDKGFRKVDVPLIMPPNLLKMTLQKREG